MATPTVKIVTAGSITFTEHNIKVMGWTYDREGKRLTPDELEDALLYAVRDYIVKQLNRRLKAPLNDPNLDEDSRPVVPSLEREAEMETYLLINRCQGNG